MSIAFSLESAPREARFSTEPLRRAAHLAPSRDEILEAAHRFDLPGQIQLESPREVLIRAVARLERSDWAILFTVAMAIAAIGVLGVLGMRLASLGPRGAIAPPPAAVSSTQAFQSLAPPAPDPAAAPQPAAPAPTAPPVPAVSTVDAGAPGAGARLRSQPRIDGSIVERIVHGAQVTELGQESNDGQRTWRQVRSAGGAVGWMDASLLRRPQTR